MKSVKEMKHLRFDSANLEWVYDDFTLGKTISSLQCKLADLQTRARIVENMLNGVIETPLASHMDLYKGLLEFTQDRPLPPRYIKFAERKTCDSLEQKREKLERKKEANDDKGVVAFTPIYYHFCHHAFFRIIN
uniref:MAK10-like protein n=1 Tax=Angiostrongylus cantonensis TaxID=6313 RepID=A0A0K0D842_ANGCA